MLYKIKSMMVMLAFLLMIVGCGGGGGSSGGDPEPDVPLTDVELTKQAVLATGSFTEASLSNAIVGPAGGTVAVTSGPLTGVKLIVPAGATTEDITFEISSSSLTSLSGLAKGIVPGDRVIRIKATGSELWNEYMFFDKPVTVTLPYSGFDPEFDETSIRFYSYDHASSSFEAAGFLSMDTDKNEITFETRSFANILPENILQADSLQLADAAPAVDTTFSDYASLGFDALEFSDWLGGATLDTGFLPSKHGFYIPNYGSFYHGSTGGACKGMSVFAKYYYQKGYTPLLYSNYKDDAPTSTWLDDATAIQLGSRVQDKYDWAGNTSEKNEQDHSWYTMRSILGAFLVTGKPTMISLYKQSNTGASLPGAHATLAYKAVITSSEITFFIYDPNYRGNDARKITFSLDRNAAGEVTAGGFGLYYGGTNAANTSANRVYNIFYHTGYRAGYTNAMLEVLKKLADKDFSGDDRFPTFTLKKITAKNTGEVIFDIDHPEETGDDEKGIAKSGQPKYITKDSSVIIEGTVLGGAAQEEKAVVDNLNVITSTGVLHFPINNSVGSGDGKFSFILPLLSGENQLGLLASNKARKLLEWAAFNILIIESDHQSSALTATLTWGAGNSDIDLWVKEPGGESVGYSHRNQVSTLHPYLDFDNTDGYGPEHYMALDGMTIPGSENGLYGTYSIHANYYSDDDEDYEHDRAISWTIKWRYLEYCLQPCEDPEGLDGFWKEGSSGGVLTSVGQNSDSIVINYEEADPADYELFPIEHTITLP